MNVYHQLEIFYDNDTAFTAAYAATCLAYFMLRPYESREGTKLRHVVFKALPVLLLVSKGVFLLYRNLNEASKLTSYAKTQKEEAARYGYLITLGMAFSSVGDVFLAVKNSYNCLVMGIVNFGIAQGAYYKAYTDPLRGLSLSSSNTYLIVVVINGLINNLVLKRIPDFAVRILLAIYSLMILTATWKAFYLEPVLLNGVATNKHLYAQLGSCLFCASDLMLAVTMFLHYNKYGQYFLMVLYYAAQYFILFSI